MEEKPVKAYAYKILREVAQEYKVSQDEIVGKNPHIHLRQARTRAIWRIKKETDFSFTRIGRIFGRDHTTIIHIYRVAEQHNGHYYNKSYKVYGGGKQKDEQ
jgi:chromosomal replication initiation ATPase DnaA